MSNATPPPDRYCDIVMKGGITSGVVYPRALSELAHQYVFRNIGGTSAGAVAAAATAAAEYQRRRNGSMAGFDRLARLSDELASKDEKTGQNRLLTLFQADPPTRRLFKVFINALNKESVRGWALAIVIGLWKSYREAAGAAVAVSALLAYVFWSFGWVTAWLAFAGFLLFGTIAVTLAFGAWVLYDLLINAVANDYGLCSGMSPPGKQPSAMTPWLHALIQEAAGRREKDDPLTFGDLWKAPLENPDGAKSINLVMFTANLSHGRPYIMPFEDPTAPLYFRKEELKKYVPAAVMEWIDKRAMPCPLPQSAGLFELSAADFPIVLAARMSMSFPLLFSAIPLWAPQRDGGRIILRRCMFSDGGICSNFPMHLFDGLIPRWPTFGMSLEPVPPKSETGEVPLVYLPQKYDEGYGERWNWFEQQEGSPARLFGFFGAILDVMQNWNDTTLARMPGVRDRVVRVRLRDAEGGLNLNMPEPLITGIADRGLAGAKELIERFVPVAPAATAAGWDEHRWVRLNVFLQTLQKKLPSLTAATAADLPYARDFKELIEAAETCAAAGCDAPLTPADAKALRDLLDGIVAFATQQAVPPATSPVFKPVPAPELRIRPHL